MGSRVGAMIAGMKQKGQRKGMPKVGDQTSKAVKVPKIKSGIRPPRPGVRMPKW